jgi:hypothetical protein
MLRAAQQAFLIDITVVAPFQPHINRLYAAADYSLQACK